MTHSHIKSDRNERNGEPSGERRPLRDSSEAGRPPRMGPQAVNSRSGSRESDDSGTTTQKGADVKGKR